MTVFRLSLAGLTDDEADQEVLSLFKHSRLERVLVEDEVGLLAKHRSAFDRLTNSFRVHTMLCIAIGPRADGDGKLPLPDFLGGVQGYGTLWVGDPVGIDWRPSAVPVANGHVGGADGHEQLVELLMADAVFDRVYLAFQDVVEGRVANPGLYLAGADDEAVTFGAALGVAAERLCGAGSGPDGPYVALLPAAIGKASLDDSGPVARRRDEVMATADAASKALAGVIGPLGRLRRGDGGLQAQLVELRAALGNLRELVAGLLRDASATGQLTDNQRRLIRSAGLKFDTRAPGTPSAPAPEAGTDRSPISRTISDAIKGGDTLALVTRRLARTERDTRRRGSRTYLPEVDKACAPGVLSRLADTRSASSLRGMDLAEATRVLGIEDARRSAKALVDLLIHVANHEWSPAVADPEDIAGARIALDGISSALTQHTASASPAAGQAKGARLSRLADTLLPVLRDLVLRCVADEASAPSIGGEEAFDSASKRAEMLMSDWLRQVQTDGVTAIPSFAASSQNARIVIEDDIAGIKDALLYPADGEMWQLCASTDIRVLESRTSQVVRFAPRLNKEALAGTLPTGEIEWTTSGSYAGMLRLVSLQTRFIDSSGGEKSAPPGYGIQ